jgi:hypothetical protein
MAETVKDFMTLIGVPHLEQEFKKTNAMTAFG